MIKLADLHQQHAELKQELDDAIQSVISAGAFINGPEVSIFEQAFASYCSSKYSLACGNGTDALEIAIAALQLPPGAEIIVPANSFVASAEAVVNNGHIPVFIDINEEHYGLDCEQLESLLSDKTAAVIAVHLFGIPADMQRIKQFCQQHQLYLIEDCAQAHGARWQGKTIGSWGDVSTFSFFPGKNLGAMGDAGAICSDNEVLIRRCRMIANHGRLDKFGHKICGRNSRMDSLQAAVLCVKLKYLPAWNELRREKATILHASLQDNPHLQLFKLSEWAEPVYHQYVVRVEERDWVKQSLYQAGIETGIHYPKTINDYEPFQQYRGVTPKAKHVSGKILSLPCHQYLTQSDLDKIIYHLGVACEQAATLQTHQTEREVKR
ncbi:DegT/DnrJ/EryC1/StrS family aminotransferase [Planctobacterium marinum]|uniref:Aminotransferase n=1 Tax=Planctobacterium marinum TaxID=1631968 RepID=A0AA48HQE9_9ALTE|nr:aminotransferase [Planctobacterium marinum]